MATETPIGNTIPTLPDMAELVNQHLMSSVAGEEMTEDMTRALTDILTADRWDLFDLVTFGRGCHSAAEVRREQGNEKAATFLHGLGQELLRRACALVADAVATDELIMNERAPRH